MAGSPADQSWSSTTEFLLGIIPHCSLRRDCGDVHSGRDRDRSVERSAGFPYLGQGLGLVEGRAGVGEFDVDMVEIHGIGCRSK